MFYIYIIQNKINNKIYVGQTNNIKNRFSQHKSISKKPLIYIKSKQYHYIHRALNKYGIINFTFLEIDTSESENEILQLEKFWIEFFRSWDRNYGYNLTSGGEGSPNRKLSQEHKNKISKSLMNNKRALGTIHTQQWKDEMSIIHSGEKNGKAKLTKQDVLDIRKFHLENIDDENINVFKMLCDKYALSISGLEKIIYRKTWTKI